MSRAAKMARLEKWFSSVDVSPAHRQMRSALSEARRPPRARFCGKARKPIRRREAASSLIAAATRACTPRAMRSRIFSPAGSTSARAVMAASSCR